MERFHRYYRLHRILSSRRLPVPRAAIERELECSRATVMRVMEAMRAYFSAPIEYLREQNGYRAPDACAGRGLKLVGRVAGDTILWLPAHNLFPWPKLVRTACKRVKSLPGITQEPS